MKFRKKPVVIEAYRFHPDIHQEYVCHAWFQHDGKIRWVEGDNEAINIHGCRKGHAIKTLENWIEVTPGDWIITGVKGEHYPCKPDIFEKTYEPVTD